MPQHDLEQGDLFSQPFTKSAYGVPRSMRQQWQALDLPCKQESQIPKPKLELTHKKCKVCQEIKPVSAFPKGRRSCTDCFHAERNAKHLPGSRRGSHFLKSYGITLEDYQARYEAQGGVCAICKQPEIKSGGRRGNSPMTLSVDHDHETGKIRGLLCDACNVSIGRMNHSPARLRAAAKYLETELRQV